MTFNIVFDTVCQFNQSDKRDTQRTENINDYFKLPIFYNEHKVSLKQNIVDDLELIKTIDASCTPVYHHLLNTNNELSTKIADQMSIYYTTDTSFLKDTQLLLQEYKSNGPTDVKYTDVLEIWKDIKGDTGFKEKYQYIDWTMFEFLNKSELFLQLMSVYNLVSPIISFCLPIFILIIPFFIIKMKGLHLTMSEYIDVLKIVAQTNAIGKLFTVNFSEISGQERIYIFVSAAFYLFSIYQNVMVCIRFNNNMKTIHSHFKEIKLYLENTISSMENYLKYSKELQSHNEFTNILIQKLQILYNINNKLNTVTEYNIYNFSKFKEIGKVLKYFYELHTDPVYEDAIMYSLGFNGYIDCIEGLQQNILERKINNIVFIKDKKKSLFKNSYYACLSGATGSKALKPVKNTIKFKKNLIITGPNASGKTTVLKSTLINIILSQQFGCGFYDSGKLAPFKHIHCYLNIPDTSGRDSLFQAEARRCKEILDIIINNDSESHCCVFDELYSGTNPEEAETSATAFMLYLQKYPNVFSLLTTHFIKVCNKLQKIKSIKNCKMDSEKINNKIKYTYKLKSGISNVKGGINVLTEMNYPKEIIDNTIEK